MGDCYYHGGYSGHYCPTCKKEDMGNLERGSIKVDLDISVANFEANDRYFKILDRKIENKILENGKMQNKKRKNRKRRNRK